MVMDVIAHLKLPVTEDERRMLVARRNNDVEALKLLLETEGGAAPPEPTPSDKGSALWQWLARDTFTTPAWGGDAPDAAKAEILGVLERYRQATEMREVAALAQVYADFTPEQQAAQERYFQSVKDLKITFDNVDVAELGEEAVVSYTRSDEFADVRTGRPMHVAVRLTKILR